MKIIENDNGEESDIISSYTSANGKSEFMESFKNEDLSIGMTTLLIKVVFQKNLMERFK